MTLSRRAARGVTNASTGLWWAIDRARHGGSRFKVFKEEVTGLRWYRDADEYGDFIEGKHKGEVGSFIPWDRLDGVPEE